MKKIVSLNKEIAGLRKEIKDIKKNQMEILEQKNTINNIFKSQEES